MTLDGEHVGPFMDAANEDRMRDEHPAVVLRDLESRRRPQAHVITFANEKGGVGKSTLAFHCAIALAHRGLQVLVVDCDRRQQTLQRFLDARDGTCRALKVALPRPRHVMLDKQSGALLMQEIARVGPDCDFIVIDLPGQDSPFARRAIALSDTVVTPINPSPTDLDALGVVNPVTHRFRQAGPFAAMVGALRDERLAREHAAFDWILAKNRVRNREHRLLDMVDSHLSTMARHLGFRTIDGLTERVGYRETLSFGLTQFDLGLIPGLGTARAANVRELKQLVEALRLPTLAGHRRVAPPPKPAAPLSANGVQSFRDAVSGTVRVRAAANVA
jgi:chromosome partitioning protein